MRRWKGYEHGVNFGGWLSQCDHTIERYEKFITEEDVKQVAAWGLDHVRVPIDYNLLEDDQGTPTDYGYKYIDRAVEWCGRYGLNMILDLHATYGFSFDAGEENNSFFASKECQDRFYRLWEALAKRYGNVGDRLAFELLNEVTDKEYCDIWNEIAGECIKRVRAIAPDVYIIIGGYHNNCIEALPDLRMPDDERIVYTFHFYEPLIFTHQGAYWIPGMDTSFRMKITDTYGQMTQYTKEQLSQVSIGFSKYDPDATLDVTYFENAFKEAVELAEERNVPLYCGEHGVIDRVDAEDTLGWYRIASEAFNKFSIGRAAWSYKEMDFGLTDDHMASVLPEVLKCL